MKTNKNQPNQIKYPQLQCQNNKKVEWVCADKRCDNLALHCMDKQCPSCCQTHKHCFNIMLQGLTEQIKEKARRQNNFISKIDEVERQLIVRLTQKQQQSQLQSLFGTYQKKQLQVLKSIYIDKQVKGLSGKQIYQFYKRLKDRQITLSQQQQNRLINSYEQITHGLINQIIQFKSSLFQSFLNNQSKTQPRLLQLIQTDQSPIDSRILQSQFFQMTKQDLQYYKIDLVVSPKVVISHKSKFQEEQLIFLNKILDFPTKIQLIFRASEHQFRADSFHQKCDNIQNTLIIVRTEFGKTIGGFTPLPWNINDGNFVEDSSGKTFLISFDLKQKFPLVQSKNAIHPQPNYGPRFGGGCDISLTDRCDTFASSYANFPTSFNNSNNYINGQVSYSLFCGSSKGYNFRVCQYEVYHVIHD